jgi:hypothetical protein
MLLERETHQFFIAYLWLRRQSNLQGTQSAINPHWAELGGLLRVADAPTDRPYLRPFWSGNRPDGKEWLNSNLAGSYAPSSIRLAPREVIDTTAAGDFILRKDHSSRALSKLLLGNQMPVVPLACFLFREYGFISDIEPATDDLIRIFREEFGYSSSDEHEFQTLYVEGFDLVDFEQIFELFNEELK